MENTSFDFQNACVLDPEQHNNFEYFPFILMCLES